MIKATKVKLVIRAILETLVLKEFKVLKVILARRVQLVHKVQEDLLDYKVSLDKLVPKELLL